MLATIESSDTLNLALQLDADQRTSWLANLFQPYVSSFGHHATSEATDDLDWRFLGMSNLKSSTYGVTEVAFFELFEPIKNEQDQPMMLTTSPEESLIPTPSTLTSSPMVTDESDISTVTHSQDLCLERNTSPEHKKHTIVISLDTQVFKPSQRQVYYVFPTDAIVEKVSQTPPYELFCSFHALESTQKQQDNDGDMNASMQSNNGSPYHQCYTDFPSSSLFRDATPDVKTEQVIKDGPLTTHLSLSGISNDLYLIIKNSVARFEVAYEKMIQLMKLHTQGVSHRCAELSVADPNGEIYTKKASKGKRKGSYQQRQTLARTTVATTTSISSTNVLSATISSLSSKVKSVTSTNDISPGTTVSTLSPVSPVVGTLSNSTPITPFATLSSANQHQNTANGSTRKCSYCGSKTTPMWRRGPEGAGTLCNACGVKWKHGKILCGKQLGPGSVNGSTSAPIKSTASMTAEKKRKQHDELKLKKDKRVKMQRQQQHRLLQKNQPSNGVSPKDEEGLDSHEDEEEEDFSDDSYEDEDDEDDEKMKHNIVAARHLTIHESPQEYQHPYYTSSERPQSRPRSMTNYTESYQPTWGHQQDSSQPPYHLQYNDQRQPYYLPYNEHHRPRRHTADISVLERGPWGDYPIGVDAVEAATVLTLLKRSSQA